jgi:hypothetical protein
VDHSAASWARSDLIHQQCDELGAQIVDATALAAPWVARGLVALEIDDGLEAMMLHGEGLKGHDAIEVALARVGRVAGLALLHPCLPLTGRDIVAVTGAELRGDLLHNADRRRRQRARPRHLEIGAGGYDNGITTGVFPGGLRSGLLLDLADPIPSDVVVRGRSGKFKTSANAD